MGFLCAPSLFTHPANFIFLPPLECKTLCSYHHDIKRFHLTCLWCIVRRYHYNKINRKNYTKSQIELCYIPNRSHIESLLWMNESRFYFLIVDDYRCFATIKNIIVRKLLDISTLFNNYPSIRQRFLTLAEGFSNV